MTSAITSSMPTSAATAFAVAVLSLVDRAARRPRPFIRAITAAMVGWTVSETMNSAAALPSQPAAIAV